MPACPSACLAGAVRRGHGWGALALAVAACLAAGLAAAGVYTPYADVRPILTALDALLPPALKSSAPTRDDAWNQWAARHDREIRARLDRGDDDTIVNWALLGGSFTPRPKAVLDVDSRGDVVQMPPLVAERVRDLVAALRTPGQDERRLFARRALERKGYRFDTAQDRERVADHLLLEVARVAREQAAYEREIAKARALGDVSEQFAERSRVFRTRGLSLDTSLLPAYAVERALAELAARRLLAPGTVGDVAVIGPGLDFSDKSSGYDFYPQQTLQPFALVDSLVRAGLAADAASLRVTTLDLSPRVNEHIAAVRRRAEAGRPYQIRLPLDDGIPWTKEVRVYWESAGDRIGTATRPAALRVAGQNVRVRTIAVRPQIASRLDAEDLNIVVQRLADRRFDLVVATNVFVYYDTLDQVLALANVEAMLRPGGILLSNNALLELPSSRLRSAGYVTVQYSNRPDDGDHVVWYRAN